MLNGKEIKEENDVFENLSEDEKILYRYEKRSKGEILALLDKINIINEQLERYNGVIKHDDTYKALVRDKVKSVMKLHALCPEQKNKYNYIDIVGQKKRYR